MKRTILLMGGIVLSGLTMGLTAQETTPAAKTGNSEEKTLPADTTIADPWDPKNNPTVAAISVKYEDKIIQKKSALTKEDIFPVLGTYESTTNADAVNVAVVQDPGNKGMVWIEGLPQGRVKALLRKSPATYKIPAQKTADDKEVEEGTLIFDTETGTLSICIGKPFNAENPAAAFAGPESMNEQEKTKTVKSKKTEKAWVYTGTKVETETAMK